MKNFLITDVRGWEALDSRGNPTVAVEVEVDGNVMGAAMVPSGASTGAFEAFELRDGGTRFGGNGVLKAVENVNTVIKRALVGKSVLGQRALDKLMIEADGTQNKQRLGANAILGTSLACARAGATALKMPLYEYIGGVNSHVLPVPMMNVINGGKHASNSITCQEFMIMPVGANSFAQGVQWCSEVYHTLKELLKKEGYSTAVGDEGGFAPDFKADEEAVEYIMRAIEKAGYDTKTQFKIALDPATTEMYEEAKKIGKEGSYYFWKIDKLLSADEMIEMWVNWQEKYPIFSIEDPLAEEDWAHYETLTKRLGKKMQLVGDDLFVTNTQRLSYGIDHKVCNSILVKVNQIGTLTEGIDAVEMAHRAGYTSIISHRSGETEDTFIADLAVALGSGQIKTGAPCRSERTAKYNRLLAIEGRLKGEASYGLQGISIK